MADEKFVEKRPWYAWARWQGAIVTTLGVTMCFVPETKAIAAMVVAYGLGHTGGGAASKLARTLFSKK